MTKSIILDLLDRMPESPSEEECQQLFKSVESIAISGNPEAYTAVALLYEGGVGVEQDTIKARLWYKKAAQSGHVHAQYLLGELYCKCLCKKKAAKWTQKAAKQGHAKAQYKLAYVYTYGHGVRKDSKKAMKWLRKAAEQQYVPAQVELGHEYAHAVHLSKINNFKAAKWYTKAAKQGNAEAQLCLGELYEWGVGVEQDYPRAYSLYKLASINGRDDANRLIIKLEKKMTVDQVAKARACK